MIKVNFGCGLSCGLDWNNYDASPTLRLQRLPLIGKLAQRVISPHFPDLARFADVTRGLPERSSAVDLVYCSHVLEHLSLTDFRIALREILRILKPGGIFRGVVPDLANAVIRYQIDPSPEACSKFLRDTYLGLEDRPIHLIARLRALVGNSRHLWMWDYKGLAFELASAGFDNIRKAHYNDSSIEAFRELEDPLRWNDSLGFECRKAL